MFISLNVGGDQGIDPIHSHIDGVSGSSDYLTITYEFLLILIQLHLRYRTTDTTLLVV